ncbi:hypothetical protein ISN75_03220 [Dyella marensis]|uniref:hypothetical protein n=1 Tax=Dyella TaxID=231454 RepID=UPI00144808B1|nr:hypothetical protein [Dyella sp. SG609]NKJ21330.1 hypothetical protein [Dyella sp. SG609]
MTVSRSSLRLLPCLLLAACSHSASEGQLPVPSGEAAATPPATAVSARPALHAPAPAGTAPAADASVPKDMSMEGPLPLPVANLPGIACTQKKKDWAPECTAGEYQIVVNTEGCGTDGIYGQIQANDQPSAVLATAFPPFPSTPVARLHDMQFVCVMANAHKQAGQPEWHYVVAIPAESVAACKHSELCGEPGAPKVEWIKPAPQGACRLEHGQYVDCAAGWVSASQYAEFSMGL